MAPKRTSGATQPPAKKAKTRAPEQPLLDFIGKCDEIPKTCREMLQVAVPICLEVVEAERHKFQVEVLDRVSGLLSSVEGKKREVIKEAETELAEIEAEKATAAADHEAKKATSTSKQDECDAKGKIVDAAREVRDEKAKILKDAQKAQEEFNTRKQGLSDEQEGFAKLLADSYEHLKAGTLKGNWQVRNKHIGELKKKLGELGAQESLGDALAQTLKLSQEKRDGTFAQATLQFAEDYFKKHTAKVAADIAGLGAEEAQHQAAIAAAEGTLGEKKAVLEGLEKEYDEMQDVWVKLEKEAAEANKTLKQTEARIPRVQKNIDKGNADLEKFLEIPALLAKLKEKSTAVPEEAEEAEAEKEGEGEAAEGAGEADEEMAA